MKAILKLENGLEFEGYSFGHKAETEGEIVINTSMIGYQNVISDPSNCNQIVVMTYPLIGNYGIELDNCESSTPTINALIVNEYEKYPRHIKCELDLDSYLKSNNIIGIAGIDTRELTRVIRSNGTMQAFIVFPDQTSSITKKDKLYNPVEKVSTKKPYIFSEGDTKVAVIDLGIKMSSLKYLSSKNFEVKVFPYNVHADEVLQYDPSLIIISSGPGSFNDLENLKENILEIANEKPTLAISLGHQLLCYSFGANIKKLKVGNRGTNYPVKNLYTNKIYNTSQNTGYYVENIPHNFEILFIGINEKNIQGVRHKTKPIISLQFDALVDDFDFIIDKLIKGEYYADR